MLFKIQRETKRQINSHGNTVKLWQNEVEMEPLHPVPAERALFRQGCSQLTGGRKKFAS